MKSQFVVSLSRSLDNNTKCSRSQGDPSPNPSPILLLMVRILIKTSIPVPETVCIFFFRLYNLL